MGKKPKSQATTSPAIYLGSGGPDMSQNDVLRYVQLKQQITRSREDMRRCQQQLSEMTPRVLDFMQGHEVDRVDFAHEGISVSKREQKSVRRLKTPERDLIIRRFAAPEEADQIIAALNNPEVVVRRFANPEAASQIMAALTNRAARTGAPQTVVQFRAKKQTKTLSLDTPLTAASAAGSSAAGSAPASASAGSPAAAARPAGSAHWRARPHAQ